MDHICYYNIYIGWLQIPQKGLIFTEGKTGTIKIKFSDFGKTYEYPIKVKSPIDPSEIALQVSKQIMQGKPIHHKSGKKEIYPAYNLLLSKLPKALTKIGVEYNLPTSINNQQQAFRMAHEATKASIKNPEIIINNGITYYKVNMHRVGMKFNNRLAVDIDDKNLENAMNLWKHCEKLYSYEFELRQTNNGFQLLGTKIYKNIDDWLFDNCKLLSSILERDDLFLFIALLKKHDECSRDIDVAEYLKSQLPRKLPGNFDIMFTVISIKRKAHTLRISKKTPNDKWVLIKR